MSTCLLVIDVQASFSRRPYFSSHGLEAYLKAQNDLIAGAEAQGWPIVQVFHISPDGSADDPFALASGQVRPLPDLRPYKPALTLHKSRHSAAVGTGLEVWLVANGIRRVVVSGIRTEQCCETTTRHLSDLGWQVDFVADATMTWDIPAAADGAAGVSAAAIRERTAAVLRGRFARVLTVDGALQAT
jgi:nicotinamidase-related amidase